MDDNIPEGTFGPCEDDCIATYQTSNGSTYEFSFEHQNDYSIRVYIEHMPSYGSRYPDLRRTQRQQDGNRFCIDWDELYTLSNAKQVAAQWARRTDRYIKTGQKLYSDDLPPGTWR